MGPKRLTEQLNLTKMKIRNLLVITALLAAFTASSQKYMTRNGYIKFFSNAPVEDIEAINNQVSSVVDAESGNFAFLVPIKGFEFENALMQEHFNENYLESGKYPNASFKGTINDFDFSKLSKDGEHQVTFSGTMDIHGVDKQITEKATFVVKKGAVMLKSDFKLRPEDYDVKIPASKKDNISDVLEITVKMDYDKK